jgi:hypothetical protein
MEIVISIFFLTLLLGTIYTFIRIKTARKALYYSLLIKLNFENQKRKVLQQVNFLNSQYYA